VMFPEGSSILVGIPTRGLVPMQWALALRALKLPPRSLVLPVAGLPIDHARNYLVQKMLDLKFDTLFFLDDDVLPPSDAAEKLFSHNQPVVSGLYYRRAEPFNPVALYDTKPYPSPLGNYEPGALIEIDLVGAGCLLIQRKIFEFVPKPWFEWRRDREDLPENERVSEDFAFCRKLRTSGIKTILDTSVQCAHLGYGQSLVGDGFTPLGGMSPYGNQTLDFGPSSL